MKKGKNIYEPAKRIFTAAADKKIDLYVSDLTIINARYISRKHQIEYDVFLRMMKILRKYVEITSAGEAGIDFAINAKIKDLEDAVQFYAAFNAKADVIVTRNEKDFTFSSIEIMSPTTFIQNHLN